MADEEQLAILKQGVEVWNKWREENPEIEIDLTDANLFGRDLSEASLLSADLRAANLMKAILRKTDFSGAKLCGANLKTADLEQAIFFGANVAKADFRAANLRRAIIKRAILKEADFTRATLIEATFSETHFITSNFSYASMGDTVFENSDLSKAIGLEDVDHVGPSIVSTGALSLSIGKIPDVFLRGSGLSDWEIEEAKLYNPDLNNEEINKILYKIYDLRATQALQISPLFISYSHADGKFVNKIGDHLNKKGVRYWRDIHDMKSGRIEKQIDRAIRQNPTVLLVLSNNALGSDWVEHEVRTARALEKDMGRDVLCPVALDDSWKSSRWPKRVMEQVMEYNILDFSTWKDDSKFGDMFSKLIDGLELFYKG